MTIISSLVIVFYIFLVANAMGAVMLDNRQPVKTIAWLLVILLIPIVGLLLYYFFGQNIRHEVLLNKKSIDLLTQKVMAHYIRQERYEVSPHFKSLLLLMKRISYSLPFGGNEARFYTSGNDFMLQLLKDVAKAQHHIHLEYFIIENDAVGRLLSDALLDAVNRGVNVRMIYDDVGCWSVPRRFFRKLRDGGVSVQAFLPVHFRWLSHRVNYRNHRKIVVIDGHIGYVGGMNIALRYLRGEHGHLWRDLQMRVWGGAVYGLQQLFLSDWYYVSGELINDMKYYPAMASPAGGGALMQITMSVPFGRWPNFQMAYNQIIQLAQKQILIQTPYFMPTETILESLQTAAMRGVHVEIMVPLKPGGFWMTWANESYYGDVLKAGVEIYAYSPGMLHAKLMVVDDEFCSVGSVNLDFRSLNDTFEDSAFIYDTTMAKQVKKLFEEAKTDCKLIDLDLWNARNWRRRVLESFVRIFSPLF